MLGAGEGLPTQSPPQSTVAGAQAGSKGPGSITNARDQDLAEVTPGERMKRLPSWCLLGNRPLVLTVLRTAASCSPAFEA